MSHEDHCDHDIWSCQRGWHECNECGRGLGSRHNQLETHSAWACAECLEDESETRPPFIRRRFQGSGKTVAKEGIRDAVADAVSSKFITKDSGERVEFESGMRRDVQDGKPRWDLLVQADLPYDGQFLTRCAELLGRGAEKYGERNWQLANSVEELNRFKASAMRHFMQWMCGELDEDHAAAVFFNLMAAEYVKGKLKSEDPTV